MPIVIDIFGQLLGSIGIVFFVLSTTSIIFQVWLASSSLSERNNPYVLYAVSNLGSFAGLLSYPLLFELVFTLNTQLKIWRIMYLVLFCFHLIAFKVIAMKEKVRQESQALDKVGFKDKFVWFLLSMAAAAVFLSVTNIITYEITPMPLLWVIPLCIYLLSFVLNFKKTPWCPCWIRDKLHLTAAYAIFLFFLTQKRILPLVIEIACHLFILFIFCMFCQNELNRRKPGLSHNLTTFYLLIACGGFVGGLLVSWVFPLIPTSMVEYLFGLFIIFFALIIDTKTKKIDSYRFRLIIYTTVLLLLWPTIFKGYNIFGLIMIVLIFKFIYAEFKGIPLATALSLFVILCFSPLIDLLWAPNLYTYRHRNYYGIYRIYEKNARKFLLNGTTVHGGQYLSKQRETEPTAYYHSLTPLGKIMTCGLFNLNRIGVIGLGTGGIAAYGQSWRVIDFFELDPDVLRIASEQFTFLRKSSSKINYILGDARISLLKMPKDTKYDMLVVDAFSGDSIPVHLLTTDAISEYLKRVSDSGIILLHISNRYIGLEPVLISNARVLDLYGCISSNRASKENDAFPSIWFALTKDKNTFEKLTGQLKWSKQYSGAGGKNIRPWTDEYSNMLGVIKIDDFLSQVKNFRLFYWDDNLGEYRD